MWWAGHIGKYLSATVLVFTCNYLAVVQGLWSNFQGEQKLQGLRAILAQHQNSGKNLGRRVLPHTVATTYLATIVGNSCYLELVDTAALTYRSIFKFKSRQTSSRPDEKRSGRIKFVTYWLLKQLFWKIAHLLKKYTFTEKLHIYWKNTHVLRNCTFTEILHIYLEIANIETVAQNLRLINGRFPTLSSHSFANYIKIFHKTEVQTVILRCWKSKC